MTTNATPEEVLAVFPRGETQEVRLTRAVHESKTRCDLRLWYQHPVAGWRPTRRGTSVLPEEVARLVEVLSKFPGG